MARHPFDRLSAILGVAAIVAAVLVGSGQLAELNSNGLGVVLAAAVLLIGIAALPWIGRREDAAVGAVEPESAGS